MADTHPNLLKHKWEFVDSPKRKVQQCSGFRHGLIQLSPGPNISLPLISGHHNSKMILFSSGSFLIMQDSCVIFKAFGKSACLSPTIVRKNGVTSHWPWSIRHRKPHPGKNILKLLWKKYFNDTRKHIGKKNRDEAHEWLHEFSIRIAAVPCAISLLCPVSIHYAHLSQPTWLSPSCLSSCSNTEAVGWRK